MKRAAVVTMRDVARRAGLNVSTVSRALDEARAHMVGDETRVRVLQIASELGYRRNDIARSLRMGRSGTVGIIVADITNPFVMSAIRGAEEVLDAAGVSTLLAETRDDHDRLTRVCQRLLDRCVDGILTSAAREGEQALWARTVKELPVVLMLRTLGGLDLPAVINDDLTGGRLAAEHLVGELGHTRVAQIVGPTDISSFVLRAQGFREAALAGSAELLEWEIGKGERRKAGIELGRRACELPERPTAVFAPTDEIAVGFLQGVRRCGLRCPEDVSIVGYYDSSLAELVDPPLTSVRIESHEVGRRAAGLLGSISADLPSPSGVDSMISLEPKLVTRASTRPR